MTKIQAEALSFSSPLIGSLSYSHEASSFSIGPDSETDMGPWTTSLEYYHDLADWLLRDMATRGSKKLKESPLLAVPVLLKHLIGIHDEERTGPFRLINRDFGTHNILVDDFNIVGVVDLVVAAVPLEAAAQYPVLSTMRLDPPGVVSTNPDVLAQIERTRPGISHYKACLARYEGELGDGTSPVAKRLGSTAALVFLGMLRCATLDLSFMEDWLTAALKLLKEHTDS